MDITEFSKRAQAYLIEAGVEDSLELNLVVGRIANEAIDYAASFHRSIMERRSEQVGK